MMQTGEKDVRSADYDHALLELLLPEVVIKGDPAAITMESLDRMVEISPEDFILLKNQCNFVHLQHMLVGRDGKCDGELETKKKETL